MSLPKPQRCRQFSVLLSTEENYQSDSSELFGPYAHIRQTLDYGFHKHYIKERQWLQDAIIEEFLESVHLTDINGDVCTTPTEPWIVFTAGAMGAGKGHTINWLVKKGLFPLLAFVGVDPDEIRRRLPEFSLYLKKCPLKAGELTRKEAGYIAEILTLAALQAGKNVLVDGSLRDSDWYTQYFARLRREYSNNNIAILHVTAPRDAVFQRAAERARRTGRIVPVETLELALEQVPKSVKILAPLADYFCELSNAPGEDIKILTEGADLDEFQVQWLQQCAWVPSERRKKAFSARRQRPPKNSEEAAPVRNGDNESKRRSSVMAIKAAPLRIHVDRKIDLTLSTEENHQSESSELFGPYSHIRAGLDYGFHKHYIKERQWLQDMIVKEVMTAECNGEKTRSRTPDPWLILVAGSMGAGKIHVVRQCRERGYLTLSGMVLIDREKVRSYLPEFAMYADQHPTTADNLTRKEVGYISEIITLAALQAGENVIVAGAMEDVDWYRDELFPRLKGEFPTLRVAILHVVAPMVDMLDRAVKVAEKKKRQEMPRERMEAQLEQVERSVRALQPVVDYFCKINNPQCGDPEILTEGESWDSFQSKWGQSCAWIPSGNRHSTTSSIEEKMTNTSTSAN